MRSRRAWGVNVVVGTLVAAGRPGFVRQVPRERQGHERQQARCQQTGLERLQLGRFVVVHDRGTGGIVETGAVHRSTELIRCHEIHPGSRSLCQLGRDLVTYPRVVIDLGDERSGEPRQHDRPDQGHTE